MHQSERMAVIIEDDADIRTLLTSVLEQAGFSTATADNGADGVELVRRHDPLVTTLDVSMPGIDGIEAAKRIRSFSSTYLLMVSARGDEIDVLQGLDAGADDYLVKPFRPRELRARVEALLRRPRDAGDAPAPATQEARVESTWIEFDGLRVLRGRGIAHRDGTPLSLTPSEFALLAAMLESAGRVRSKAELAVIVRGNDSLASEYLAAADLRTIEVHMANLRRKLGEDSSSPRWIETVRGVGYRLAVH